MKKEEIYVNLQGKTKEELKDLWEFLKSNGEPMHCDFRRKKSNYALEFFEESWIGCMKPESGKQEVTIEQLKQIIKPMETLQQQLQKAEAEVKRLQSLIEEENKPKVGDFVFDYNTNSFYKLVDDLCFDRLKKITNPELIKLLENECSTKN